MTVTNAPPDTTIAALHSRLDDVAGDIDEIKESLRVLLSQSSGPQLFCPRETADTYLTRKKGRIQNVPDGTEICDGGHLLELSRKFVSPDARKAADSFFHALPEGTEYYVQGDNGQVSRMTHHNVWRSNALTFEDAQRQHLPGLGDAAYEATGAMSAPERRVAAVRQEDPAPPAVRQQDPAPPVARQEDPAPPVARQEDPAPPVARQEDPAPPVARQQDPAPPVARQQDPAPPVARQEDPAPPVARQQDPAPPVAVVDTPEEAPREPTPLFAGTPPVAGDHATARSEQTAPRAADASSAPPSARIDSSAESSRRHRNGGNAKSMTMRDAIHEVLAWAHKEFGSDLTDAQIMRAAGTGHWGDILASHEGDWRAVSKTIRGAFSQTGVTS